MPFSLSTLETTGEPFLVSAQSALPTLSRDGTLMFLPQAPLAPLEVIVVDAAGEVLSAFGQPKAGLRDPRLSPDGRHLAAAAQNNGRFDVWIYDLMRGAQARLTFGEGDEWPQAWSPSGDRVFFAYNSPTDRERKLASRRWHWSTERGAAHESHEYGRCLA